MTRKKSTDKERADSFLDMVAKSIASGKVEIVSCKAVAPCGHEISQSKCVGTPDAQNLWRCSECGKEWLR